MYGFKLSILSAVLVFVGFTGTSTVDERTCSKFECEYKILERMVLLEYKNTDLEKKQVICERKIEELGEIWKEQRIEMERLFKEQTESMVAMEEKHESDIRRIEETTAGTNVAFTAVLSTHTSYSRNQVLVFDRIVTNAGDGYSGNSGKFTAKSKGVYLFSLTIFTYRSLTRVDLMKNGQCLGSTYSEDKSSGDDTASVTVVTALNKGDTVYAKFNHGSTSWDYLIHNNYTTFTGVQIQ